MDNVLVEYACSYARKFHAIVPVGSWTYENREGKTVDLWKHPLLKGWSSDPLRTEKQVRDFWKKEARYGRVPGIAVATGQISGGYIVVDLDRKPERGIDGYEYLKNWQRETGLKLPEDTWTAVTGSGGYHLWFHTGVAMRSYANDAIGVDLRADGGCVILPPSLHPNGRRYAWEMHPKDFECAEATEAVYRFIEHCRPSDSEYRTTTRRGEGGSRKMLLPQEIPDGGRHRALISMIGTLNRLGVSDETIIEVVRRENEEKCRPVLTETELQHEVFPAIFRFEKGIAESEWKDETMWKTEQAELWRKEQKLKREQARLGF